MLAPIFLWGALAAGGRWSGRLVAAFVILHLCLYGGATAFNSWYDRDEEPIGGLKRPPPVPDQLMVVSLALMALGAVASLAVRPAFAGVYLAMLLLGVAYSHPLVRFKSRPWASILVVALGQGWLGFLAGYLAAGAEPASTRSLKSLEAGTVAVLVTTSLYPLTQVYQVAADRRRGDRTFGAVYGPRGCFRFSMAGAFGAGLALADYGRRFLSPAEGALLAAALLAAIPGLYLWSRRFDPTAVERNYERVMGIGYATSATFAALILWHMAR
jgi:1,4-dihydroxy-2-naphthoate octaprenyltransferase